jgi:hypothetical protein
MFGTAPARSLFITLFANVVGRRIALRCSATARAEGCVREPGPHERRVDKKKSAPQGACLRGGVQLFRHDGSSNANVGVKEK